MTPQQEEGKQRPHILASDTHRKHGKVRQQDWSSCIQRHGEGSKVLLAKVTDDLKKDMIHQWGQETSLLLPEETQPHRREDSKNAQESSNIDEKDRKVKRNSTRKLQNKHLARQGTQRKVL